MQKTSVWTLKYKKGKAEITNTLQFVTLKSNRQICNITRLYKSLKKSIYNVMFMKQCAQNEANWLKVAIFLYLICPIWSIMCFLFFLHKPQSGMYIVVRITPPFSFYLRTDPRSLFGWMYCVKVTLKGDDEQTNRRQRQR